MLTIGEFSRLGRISARMLRYYDAIGLLRPEYVAENGYRFYDQRQLADLQRIRRLNDYGFPLSQISELLGFSSPQYFSRKFAQEVGCPPSLYADSLKKEVEASQDE